MRILLTLFVSCHNLLYQLCYLLFLQKKKIIFISRRGRELNEDFALLQSHLSDYEIITISMKDDGSFRSNIQLLWLSLKSCILLATCRVCVLDGYWATVSVLKNKKFKVVQIWHSIGKIKQSGYQTLNKTSGRSRLIADVLRMHRNYDVIISGGQFWEQYYVESFGVEKGIIKPYGLPRIDNILNNQDDYKQMFQDKYPLLLNKPIVLYAPTFRKGYDFDFNQLADNFDFDKFNLVIKLHSNSNVAITNSNVYICEDVSTRIVMSVAEYVITDYSSVVLEAMINQKKVYHFIPDYKEYLQHNGLNIDMLKLYPELCFTEKDAVMNVLNSKYPYDTLSKYRKIFFPDDVGNSTKRIADLIKQYFNQV
ncbi:CDP-glycerol glycerophosphotransferase family protein [Pasteurella atlantica]|uniref:CDP-glycerol glycerophosphotransferase family protein n=2 Tax=Pasteurellaceae TaxID=712 RepID=A0ACC6HN59_9PAST|nr:CDP-glycerol glycerophosphotransferase family protein [Pasteurella atlantica]MDP8052302.1 CDP-glycerol glycerophosphotransferase family protein [Pasteurella atlantica]MDP8101759.1 CDP-glycerol glycerophosphotransferase family protein [Pasteurella atlantica]MDP8105788.1 CDP-glycerol glycerophosphotransferase family protein [Pasteurella atlantica]MDP8149147.1 CDP-glycerol glycerophosphotransferase family protein [Pasteurella atlantica]